MRSYDVVVAGGGINGLMTAWFCQQRGLRVALFEQGQIGQRSTWAGGGIIAPLAHWKQPRALLEMAQFGADFYPPMVKDLVGRGVNPELDICGMAVIDDQPIPAVDGLELFSSRQVSECSESVRRVVADTAQDRFSTFFPAIGQIRPPRLIRAFRDFLATNVDLYEFETVTHFEQEAGRVVNVATDRGRYAADHIIVCSGAWAGPLLAETGVAPDVKPMRGQMIAYQPNRRIIDAMIFVGGKYVIPRRDNLLVIGSSVEDVGFDNSVTEEVKGELVAFAEMLLPELVTHRPVAHWSGLRPQAKDGIPVIDRHPALENLWVNVGQFRNGLTLAPASANMLMSKMFGDSTALPLDAVAWPDRSQA